MVKNEHTTETATESSDLASPDQTPQDHPTTEQSPQGRTAGDEPSESPSPKATASGAAFDREAALTKLQAMSAQERFRASRQLLFVAPDVPPIAPRPRRSDLRQLDQLLDRHLRQRADDPRVSERGQQNRGSDRGGRAEQSSSDGEGADDHSTGRKRKRGGQDQDPGGSKPAKSESKLSNEPQKVKGSTRLEAKRQRRREGRDAGRRRTVVTESEFLARRESVDRKMVVRALEDRTQIGVLEDDILVEHYVARASENSIIGNVYLGRVQNVLPSMEAAFVDIGRGRNAVLYSGEVDWSEYEGSGSSRKIENVLKPGDPVLVQVTKDPVGHKGARLTSQVSLPGRYLVYVPGGTMNGISRKLPDTERARLKKVLKEIVPGGSGVIVRTAAEGATEEQLTRDVQHLTTQWEEVQKEFAKGGEARTLHAEPDTLIKIVRDVFNEDFEELVVSGDETFHRIERYLTRVAPDLFERTTRYEGERDVFDKYRITEQIQKALDRKVWLPSGGSLVIDRTEAMTVIDVNTGKFVGTGGNLEETVTKNNLEAAEEVVRQLRLRDTGGIIVIDFIDMVLESNRDLVHRRLIECLGRDRTKHQVSEVTSLGLVQMTRKKIGLGLLESFSEPCEVCAGRGVIVHTDPVTRQRQEQQSGRRRGGRGAGRNQKSGANGSNSGESGAPASGNGNENGSRSRQSRDGAGNGNSATASSKQHSGAAVTTAGKGAGGGNGTHSLSEGAKNMIAQVAAKTIGGSVTPAEEVVPVAEPAEATPPKPKTRRSRRRADAAERPEPDADELISAIPQKAKANDVSSVTEPDVDHLLDQLLDALPNPESASRGTEPGAD